MAIEANKSPVASDQIDAFRKQGYLYYGPLFSPDELIELRQTVQGFIDNEYPACYRTDLWLTEGEQKQPLGKERFLQMCGLFKHSKTILKYAVQRKRGEIIAALLGCDSIQLLSDMILYKPPGKSNSRPTKWHKDYPTNPNDKPDVTSWMPLDDVDESNGCMQYLPATHELGDLVPPGKECRENYEKVGIDFSNPVIVRMKAGEVVFHHSNVLHYASANTSDRPRRVYITRYMPGNSTYRWRAEVEELRLYEGWKIKERHGQKFAEDEFPRVFP
jgi:hypothetical protein